jgi:hypothetical protein
VSCVEGRAPVETRAGMETIMAGNRQRIMQANDGGYWHAERCEKKHSLWHRCHVLCEALEW